MNSLLPKSSLRSLSETEASIVAVFLRALKISERILQRATEATINYQKVVADCHKKLDDAAKEFNKQMEAWNTAWQDAHARLESEDTESSPESETPVIPE